MVNHKTYHTAPDCLVLQGGARRAVFSLGFLQSARPALQEVNLIAAVSSGVAVACAHLLDRHEEAFELCLDAARDFRNGFSIGKWFRGQRPTQHFASYRALVNRLVTVPRWQELHRHPTRLRILIGLSPGRSRLVAGALAFTAFRLRRSVPGLTPYVIEAQQCHQRDEFINAMLASAAVPIACPLPLIADRVAVDGSTITPIPLCAAEGSLRPLLVLTQLPPPRPIPSHLQRVAPDNDLTHSAWDLGNEQGLRSLYEQGLMAGQRYARTNTMPDSSAPH